MGGLADASIMSMIDNPDPNQRGKLLVAFAIEAVINQDKSAAEGRPIYDDLEMITIFTPGDTNNVVRTQVNDIHKRRYADIYKKWKENTDAQVETGTPVKLLPGIMPSQVAELHHFHIRTVEALAAVSDGNAQRVGPISKLRQLAKDYLAAAAGMAPINALREEMKSKDSEMDALKRQLKELGDKFEANVRAQRGEAAPKAK